MFHTSKTNSIDAYNISKHYFHFPLFMIAINEGCIKDRGEGQIQDQSVYYSWILNIKGGATMALICVATVTKLIFIQALIKPIDS